MKYPEKRNATSSSRLQSLGNGLRQPLRLRVVRENPGGQVKAKRFRTERSRMKRAGGQYNVLPTKIHLAFDVPEWHLQSEGFSQLVIIDPLSDPSQESDPSTHPSSVSTFSDALPEHSIPTSDGRFRVEHVGIILKHKIAQATIGDIWGGDMILEGAGQSLPVVVKMTVCTEGPDMCGVEEDPEARYLRAEAVVYEHLAANSCTEFDITPYYYGLWRDNDGSVILVLDDVGTPGDTIIALTLAQYVVFCIAPLSFARDVHIPVGK
ncbi:hypothetical protein C8R44DRAFT_40676 [Mycena epipterygia]|nr:hypothetical protein C8R44DRAFT_40676 [Mycena epipterygia]